MEHIVALPQYDVLAYLIAGMTAIAACDLIFGTRIFFRTGDWGVSRVAILIVVGYVAGQIIAVFSSWLIEDTFVARVVGRPIEHLMTTNCLQSPKPRCEPQTAGFLYSMLPYVGYSMPLECNTQNKICEKLNEDKKGELGDGKHYAELFWQAYNTAKQDKDTFERIVTFHEEYNFARNMSFVLFLGALGVLFQWRLEKKVKHDDWQEHAAPQWMKDWRLLLIMFVLVGCGLFARYLYFYRAHSIEVLTSYAYGG